MHQESTPTINTFLRRTLGMLFLLISTSVLAQQAGIFQTYAIVNRGNGNEFRAGGFNADGAAAYQNWQMGSFFPNQTLILNGGEIKTFKNGGGDVLGAEIFYRVYPFGTDANLVSFTTIDLPFSENLPAPGDQKWARTAHNVNLLAGRTAGTWVLEVFWRIRTNLGDRFDSRFGQNFQAIFSVSAPAASGEISGPTSACAGATNLQFSTPVIAGATSYNWVLPSGYSITSGQGTNSISVNLEASAESGTITVSGQNAAGSGASSNLAFTVNAIPAAPVITANGALQFCEGGSVELTSNYATGNLWSNGANTQSIVVDNSASLTVVHTDANGCQSSASSAVEVIESPIPSAPVITASGSTTICTGGVVTLSSSYENGNVWSNESQDASIQVSTAGTYTVIHTDGNGCQSPASAPVEIVVNPGVSPCSFSQLTATKSYNPTVFNDGLVSFCSPVTLQVPPRIDVTSGNAGNHWSFIRYTNENGQNITLVYRGGASQAHPSSTNQINLGQRWNYFGAYLNYNGSLPPNQPNIGLLANQPFTTSALRLTVNGSNRFGTTGGRATFVNQTPGCNQARYAEADEIQDEPAVAWMEERAYAIYPNPSTSEFQLETFAELDNLQIEVWDASGRLMERFNATNNSRIQLGANWKPGVYIVRLFGDDFSETTRLIKN